uniref:MYND-type domain-containing protein n=1 Tax=Strongyloides stercoralis TaxID=6248 RepID=A0A913HMQ6_STRER
MSDNDCAESGKISPHNMNTRNVIRRHIQKFYTSVRYKLEGTTFGNAIRIFYIAIMTILFSWAILVISPKRKAKAITKVPEKEVLCRGDTSSFNDLKSPSPTNDQHSCYFLNENKDISKEKADLNSNILSTNFILINKTENMDKKEEKINIDDDDDDNNSISSSTSPEKILKPNLLSQYLTTDEIINNPNTDEEQPTTTSKNLGMYERVKSGVGLALFKKNNQPNDNISTQLFKNSNDDSSGTYYFYQDHTTSIQDYLPNTSSYITSSLYLDSITEEDSDDLRSLSSASSLLSPQKNITNYSSVINRLPSVEDICEEESLEKEEKIENITPTIEEDKNIIVISHVILSEDPLFTTINNTKIYSQSKIETLSSSSSEGSVTTSGQITITSPTKEDIEEGEILRLSPTIDILGEIAEPPGVTIDIISNKESHSPVDDLLSEATESVADSVVTILNNNNNSKNISGNPEEILDIFIDEELPLDPFTDKITSGATKSSVDSKEIKEDIDKKTPEKLEKVIVDKTNMEAHQDRDTSEMIVSDLFAGGYPIEDTSFSELDRLSPESTSIILDRSRDSLLDQSICSNPRDETHIMAAYASRHFEEDSDQDDKNIKSNGNEIKQTVTKTFISNIPSSNNDETKRNSDILDDDLPPPPEQLKTVTSYTPQPLRPTILPPAPPSQIPKQFKETDNAKEEQSSSTSVKGNDNSGRNSAQRLPQFLYGYGTVGPYHSTGNSPTTTILVTTPWISTTAAKKDIVSPPTISTVSSTEEDNQESTTQSFETISRSDIQKSIDTEYKKYSKQEESSYPNLFRNYNKSEEEATKKYTPTYPESSKSIASTIRNIPVKVASHTESTSDILSTNISTDFSNTKAMETPAFENPGVTSTTTNIPLTKPYISDYYSTSKGEGPSTTPYEYYRDELLSEGRRSRSTIREVPIQREHRSSSSLLGPSSNFIPATTMTTEYRTTSTTPWTTVDGGNPHQEEYFRREVTTRTLITRSSETLSQLPYYSRDGSADKFQQPLPLPSTTFLPESTSKDDFGEEYKLRIEKITQEEERRIRENQERRRREEEERRFKEEEDRKLWEREEYRRLQQIKEEKERIEKELASEAARREKDERMRIERDRILREEMERKRRNEWDESERARREAEEKELAKKREMLEIKLQRERIEIERIERIKREQLIKQREMEMEKLRKEREEAQLQKELEEARLKREAIEREARLIEERERIEAENRERERIQDEIRKRQIAEEEARERNRLAELEREVQEKERLRKLKEQEEQERLAAIRREEEMLLMKHRDAQERERLRQLEEAEEREKILQIERAAAERRAQREKDKLIEEELRNKARIADEIKEEERRQAEKHQRDRLEEERRLYELKERERQNQQYREQERRQVEERESKRRMIDSRSRERLDELYKKKEELDFFEQEKRRLLREREEADKRKSALTSKETLERLTRKPYFSRENLSTIPTSTTGEITTKIHREVIDKYTRTFVTEDLTVPYGEDSNKDRMYLSKKSDDEFYRNDSSRMSKYKSNLDKAKKDFLIGGGKGDENKTDPINEKFKKSAEELSSKKKIEYRGPLLQKFHDDTFSSSKTDVDFPGTAYPKLGPSPYEEEIERLLEKAKKQYSHYRAKSSQPNLYSKSTYWDNSFVETNVDTGKDALGASRRTMEETNLDEVHRSRQSYQHTTESTTRFSRSNNIQDDGAPHTRSKSADYLLDRIKREETAPPENELQKSAYPLDSSTTHLSEHELRFRKSTEKLSTPDWYENRQQNRPTTSIDNYNGDNRPQSRQSYKVTQSYENPSTGFSETVTKTYNHSVTTSSYPNYDTDHQQSSSTKKSTPIGGIHIPPGMFDKYKDEIAEMRRSRNSLQIAGRADQIKTEPTGYTVSSTTTNSNTRVIEVVDTFTRTKSPQSTGNITQPTIKNHTSTTTVEEAMEKIYEKTIPSGDIGFSDDRAFDIQNFPRFFHSGPSIFCNNVDVWRKVLENPQSVEELVEDEKIYVRCSNCPKVKEIHDAKNHYVSCKHCYNYYCSRECRRINYDNHRDRCSYARINTLCKEIIIKVRRDPEAQWYMSKVAREGYKDDGRGWEVFNGINIKTLLFFYPIHVLEIQKKEQSLITLCKKYNPQEKFILSVSIIADVETCPETPPNERMDYTPIIKNGKSNNLNHINGYKTNGNIVTPTNV